MGETMSQSMVYLHSAVHRRRRHTLRCLASTHIVKSISPCTVLYS